MKLERYISPEYLRMQQHLHSIPKGYGGNGDKWTDAVADMIRENECKSILDYGCGQGTLAKALLKKSDLLVDIHEYDPAIRGKDQIEKYKKFDLIVCTDVLEHIEPDKLGIVIDHIFRLSNKLVFLVIATRPSNKWLLDNRNAHLIIEPGTWWMERLLHPNFEEIEAPKSPLEKKSREVVLLFRRIEEDLDDHADE